MSKRKKEIRDAEPDHETKAKRNRALFMVVITILAVGIPSAVAA